MFQLLLLLLPVAAASSWYFGFKYAKDSRERSARQSSIPDDYFVGLNYLINEQPDKAVDVFVKMLEVNSDTVETHLALGVLFRKRGEVDRAIRIHQNVIARPQLGKNLKFQALSELAQDYLCAGFLDRAERLLLDLVKADEGILENHKYLLSIYELQKNWSLAIETAKKLAGSGNKKMWTPIAYYYCELAEIALAQGLETELNKNLKKAIESDKNCVRVSIMLANMEFDSEQYKAAIRACKRVKEQDPGYLPEVLDLLAESYTKLGMENELIDYLKNCLSDHQQISVVLFLSKYIQKYSGSYKALEFIKQYAAQHTSLNLLSRFIEIFSHELQLSPTQETQLQEIQQTLQSIIDEKPKYRCINCGFSGKELYWQCPGCKHWAVSKPINDLN